MKDNYDDHQPQTVGVEFPMKSLKTPSEELDIQLFELYLRADISNNRTENPIMFEEFKAKITKLIKAERIEQIEKDYWAYRVMWADDIDMVESAQEIMDYLKKEEIAP